MKKLIVALAVVAMGVAANAASYSWSCGSGRIFDGEGGTAYASVAGQTAYLMFTSVMSQGDLVSGFNAAGGTSYASTVAGKAIGTATITSAARIDATSATADVTANDTAYFVVFANDKMYVSTEASAEYLAVGTSGITFTSQSTPSKTTLDAAGGYSAAGWYSAASAPVPEPTSGLLMLLGMAGLALRRGRRS